MCRVCVVYVLCVQGDYGVFVFGIWVVGVSFICGVFLVYGRCAGGVCMVFVIYVWCVYVCYM